MGLPHGATNGRHRLSVEMLLLRSNSYANAEGWDDLVDAFTVPLRNSSLDEIILLLHIGTIGPHEPGPKHVRPVYYNTLDEVPELLLSTTLSALRIDTTPAHQRWPRVGTATGVRPDSNHGRQRQQKRIEMREERVVDGKEAAVAIPSGSCEEKISGTRVNAAKVMQAAYHRHLKGKGTIREGIDAIQVQYWRLLRKRSMEMEWTQDSRYYLLFRVPLAYILVCLDTIKAFTESEKKQAKKRMGTEDHRGLEELMEALNQYRYEGTGHPLYRGFNMSSSKLLKRTIALQKKLSPSSKFHEVQSVNDLQGAVLEVKAVVESLDSIPGSIGTRNRIKECWDRGWKWIFEKQGSDHETEGEKAKKPVRP